jgi:hypothetical protein
MMEELIARLAGVEFGDFELIDLGANREKLPSCFEPYAGPDWGPDGIT